MYYIFDDQHETWAVDFATWCDWSAATGRVRQLADTRIEATGSRPFPVRITTIFLGIEDRATVGGPPILWETRIQGGPLDGRGWRFATYAAARAGHAHLCRAIRRLTGSPVGEFAGLPGRG